MGFLGGLTELLGGFAAKNQIDKDGFDWREKRQADQFARDRTVQVAGQEDEDRAVGQIADVLAAQEGEPDTSSIPREVLGADTKWRVQQALGKLPERKSRIEASKSSALWNKQLLAGDQRRGDITARAEAAVPGREDTQAHQTELLKTRLETMEKEGGLNREMARTLAELRAQGGGGGGKWAWNTEKNTSEWMTPQALAEAPPGMYTDVTSGRMRGKGAEAGEAAQTLIENADQQLGRYEASNQGMGRLVPAQMSPTKAVAWNAYLNSIQTLAQLMGRTVLGDNRVSEQDRIAYANAIGSTSQIVNMLDPAEARRRLDLLKRLQNDYNQKYGISRTSTLSTQSPPAGSGAAPLVQHSPSTGQYRHSFDGGNTWQPGRP